MQAFLLGAGASYEFGMPLVWELTNKFKADHKPHLKMEAPARLKFCRDWGEDATALLSFLVDDERIHYEAIIGSFEVESNRNIGPGNKYDDVRSHIVDMISRYLNNHQHSKYITILRALHFTKSFKKFVENNKPLDVFTLNHDIILEEILQYNDIDHKAGFHKINDASSRYFNGNPFKFDFELLEKNQIENYELCFFKQGEAGVNIYKLHGALDTFLHNSCKDYIRFFPSEKRALSHLQLVKAINHENSLIEQRDGIRSTQMLTLEDGAGLEHFFDRSLITGALKFNDSTPAQKSTRIFFELFKRKTHQYDEIIAAGYGFGDQHVNKELASWLASSSSKKLTIIDPYRVAPPDFALHLSRQIEIKKCSFLEFVYLENEVSIEDQRRLFLHQQEREFQKRFPI